MVSLPRVREKYPQKPGKEIVVSGIVVPGWMHSAAMLIPNKVDGKISTSDASSPSQILPWLCPSRH